MSLFGEKVSVVDPAASIGNDREAIDAVITGRYASRQFSKRAVPREIVEDVLDVARFCPSGGNIQPWQVYVLSGQTKENVSAALLNAYQQAPESHSSEYAYYAKVLPEPYRSRKDEFGRIFYGALGIDQNDANGRAMQTSKNYEFFGAPVGLIITIDRRLELGSWLDLGMFVQNVMIAAGARGLQTCPQETFAKYHAVLRQHLPIPDEQMVACGMSIGFADCSTDVKRSVMPKVPVSEFARFLGFTGSEI